jgi:hypothetical protein
MHRSAFFYRVVAVMTSKTIILSLRLTIKRQYELYKISKSVVNISFSRIYNEAALTSLIS